MLDFPIDVGVSMRDSLYQFYPFGVKNQVNLPDSNIEINLNGSPWMSGHQSTKGGCQYHIRAVLGKMMAVAAKHGWYVSTSADVSSKGGQDFPFDVHSIYFAKMH